LKYCKEETQEPLILHQSFEIALREFASLAGCHH